MQQAFRSLRPRPSPEGSGRRAVNTSLSFILAPCLLVAVVVASTSDVVGASTPTSLTMTAGTFAVKHHTPSAVPVISTPVFTGEETTKAGTFSTGTFKFPTQNEANTGSNETILVFTAPTTTTAASVSSAGDFSLGLTLTYEVHITTPVTEACVTSKPVHATLLSTAPYTSSSKAVTVTASTITIPTFSKTGCSLAASDLDKTFSGAGGELGLTLHGTVVVPSTASTTPTTSSRTVLTASPASPQVAGTTVTLEATVEHGTGAAATGASGLMTFRNGTTVLGTATVAAGTASLATKTLPVGTDTLTAVFSGGGGYEGSTSAPISYVVESQPATGTKTTGTKTTGTKGKTCWLELTLRLLTLRVRLRACT